MVKTYLLATALALGLFGFFIFSFMKTNEYIFKEGVAKSTDIALKEALDLLEKEEEFALSLSILISQNKEIVEALKNKNRDLAFREITKQLNLLKSFSKREVIDVQIHNEKMETFIRSWDFSIYGVPLQDFRTGVQKVHHTKKPTVSVELGQRLNIKAISPILEDGNIYGSIEVIIGFENIQKELLREGVSFIVLLDKKHLNIATTHRNSESFGRYVLVSSECSAYCKNMIESFLNQKKSSEVHYDSDFSIGLLPLRGMDGEELGLIGVFFPISATDSKYIVFEEFV